MALVVLSGAFKPQVDMRSLSPGRREEIRRSNLWDSIKAVCAAYLLYSALQGPDTHMVRPHPAIWKVMHGLFILYLLFLVFLLCQETNDCRSAPMERIAEYTPRKTRFPSFGCFATRCLTSSSSDTSWDGTAKLSPFGT